MILSKKNRTKQCKIQNGTFFKMTVAKKRQPNSVKLQKRLFENDCGQNGTF